MKKNTVAILSIVIVSAVFTARTDLLAQRRTRGSQPAASSLPLEKQAEQAAQAYWRKRVVRCGDSHYKWGRIAINGPLGLVEMKNISFQTSGAPPEPPRTRADILNERDRPSGLQWQGQSVLNHEVYRYMSGDSRAWNPWSNGGREIINLEKRNGKWILPTDSQPITCHAVGAFALKPGALPTTGNPPTIDDGGTLTFPARYPRWFSIGTGPLTLTIKGNPYPQIQFARGPSIAIPTGPLRWSLPSKLHSRALAPNIELGTLIAKMGENGQPFMPFQQKWMYGSSNVNTEYRFDTTDDVFLAINDYDFSDNLGSYVFSISDRRAISSTVLREETREHYGLEGWKPVRIWDTYFVRSDGVFDTNIPIGPDIDVTLKCDNCAWAARAAFLVAFDDKAGNNVWVPAEQFNLLYMKFSTDGVRNSYVVNRNWQDTLKVKVGDPDPTSYLHLTITVKPLRR